MGKPPDKSLGARLEIFATFLGVKPSLRRHFRHYLPKRSDLGNTYVKDLDNKIAAFDLSCPKVIALYVSICILIFKQLSIKEKEN